MMMTVLLFFDLYFVHTSPPQILCPMYSFYCAGIDVVVILLFLLGQLYGQYCFCLNLSLLLWLVTRKIKLYSNLFFTMKKLSTISYFLLIPIYLLIYVHICFHSILSVVITFIPSCVLWVSRQIAIHVHNHHLQNISNIDTFLYQYVAFLWEAAKHTEQKGSHRHRFSTAGAPSYFLYMPMKTMMYLYFFVFSLTFFLPFSLSFFISFVLSVAFGFYSFTIR